MWNTEKHLLAVLRNVRTQMVQNYDFWQFYIYVQLKSAHCFLKIRKLI